MNFQQVTHIDSHQPGKSQKTDGKRVYVCVSEQMRYVKLWRESRLTQAAFGKQHALRIKTFDRWLKNNKEKQTSAIASLASPSNNISTLTQVDHLELRLSTGATVSFKGALSSSLVIMLIQEACACKFN